MTRVPLPAFRRIATGPVAILLVISGATSVGAQDRKGIFGGFSLGGGNLSVSGESSDPATAILDEEGDKGAAWAVDVYIGGMVRPRFGLLAGATYVESGSRTIDGDVRVGTRRVTALDADSSRDLATFGVGAQWWPSARVWLRGMAGGGVFSRNWAADDAGFTVTFQKGTGAVLQGAAGVELVRRGPFVLDARFLFTTTFLEGMRIHAPTVQAGFSWY